MCAHAYNNKNSVLRNGKYPDIAVNSLIDQGVAVTKTLRERRAPRREKYISFVIKRR